MIGFTMSDDFEKQVAKFAQDAERALLNVSRDAIQSLVNEAESKMRVDTGFMKNSGVEAIDQFPVGETHGRDRRPGEQGQIYNAKIDGKPFGIKLAEWKIGQDYYYGWTARYAKHQEARRAFLETALQNWGKTVNVSIKKFRNGK